MARNKHKISQHLSQTSLESIAEDEKPLGIPITLNKIGGEEIKLVLSDDATVQTLKEEIETQKGILSPLQSICIESRELNNTDPICKL